PKLICFFSQAEDGIRDFHVTGVQTCALPISDLVEEVMRMVGVDNVPVEPLPRLNHVAPRMLTTIQNRRRIARRALAARGLDEAVTWSFISHAEASRFGGGQESLQLANAIAADMTD